MSKFAPVQFLKEVRVELSKVVWPSKRETIRLTLIIIGVSLAVGIFLGGIDFVLTKIMEVILRR